MKGMAPEDIMLRLRRQVDLALTQFFDKEEIAIRKQPSAITDLVSTVKEFTLQGGKRLRPILVVLGYQGVGGTGLREIMKAAIAVELMQSFLLIHDDIIDNDSLRRGKPTVHTAIKQQISSTCKDPTHGGLSLGILAGDICAMLGTRAIIESGFRSERRLQATAIFTTVALNTIYGEALDVKCSYSHEIDETAITTIHHLKTALYTLDGPLQIGAVLAGATEQQQRVYSRYAIPLGRAFQIKDDILGLFAESSTLGKPIGSDIKEGKKTLLILKALDHATPAEKRMIEKSLGNMELHEKDIQRIKAIIERTGSLAYSQAMMHKLAQRAKGEIQHSTIKSSTRAQLIWLADYVINRRR